MKNNQYKIIFIDNDPQRLGFFKNLLIAEGYSVLTASDPVQGMKIIKETVPHLVFIELLLEDTDGISLCFEIREHQQFDATMIVVLSTRDDSYSQIAAFKAGADDYLIKPINPHFLISKVHSLLRRWRHSSKPVLARQKLSGLVIDREKYQVWRNGAQIKLPHKEFEIFSLLASRPGKVFTREEITKGVWGPEKVIKSRVIDVHIRKIREKLGEALIKTIKGVGYKFQD